MNQNRKNQLPLWVKIGVSITLVTLLLSGVLFIGMQRSEHREITGVRCMDNARLKESEIANWRKDQVIDARLIANSPFIVRELVQLNENPNLSIDKELSVHLYSIKAQHDYFDILLVDNAFRIRANLNGHNEVHQFYTDTLKYVFTQSQTVFVDLYLDEKLPGKTFVSVIAPIVLNDSVIGALILVNDASDFLYPILDFWPTPSKTAETFLVKKDGDHVLYLTELRHQNNAALNLKILLNQNDLPAAKAIKEGTGIVTGVDYRGEKVIAAFLPVSGSLWYIIAKMDMSEAMTEWRSLSLLILLLMFASVGFMMIIAKVMQQQNLKRYYHDLYQSEAALRVSLEKHAVTLHSIGDAVISTDEEGRVELMNPIAENLTGWKQEEAKGEPLNRVFRIINEENRKPVENAVGKVLDEGLVIGLANHTLLIHKDGKEIPIADSGAPILNDNKEIIGVVLVFRDQTEERMARWLTDFRLSLVSFAVEHTFEESLTYILQKVGARLFSPLGSYYFVEPNQQTVRTMQFFSDDFIGNPVVDRNRVYKIIDFAGLHECVNQRIPIIYNESNIKNNHYEIYQCNLDIHRELIVPIIRKDNVVAIVSFANNKNEYTNEDAEFVSSFLDLTWEIISQKRVEGDLRESERRLNQTGQIGKIGGWEYDFLTEKAVWTRAMYEIIDIPFDTEPPMTKAFLALFPENSQMQLESALREMQENGRSYDLELQCRTKNGNLIWCRILGQPVSYNGRPVKVRGIFQDISELKAAQLRIQSDLKEKEVLIRELYHRTKNNMQVITAMLHLQARAVQDKNIQTKFIEVENKIQAMALVHKKLYESQNLSHLNLKQYIESLLELLEKSLIPNSTNIRFSFKGEDMEVLLDTAMPIGLLINEIVTNSIKYAFPDDGEGEIDVQLFKTSQKEIVLKISDNGVGLPEHIDVEAKRGIGIQTIYDLVEYQLQGRIQCNNNKGLNYIIMLNEELYMPRV